MPKPLAALFAVILAACGGLIDVPVATSGDAGGDAAADADPGDGAPDCGCRNVVPLTFPLCPTEIELTRCPGPE